MGSAPLTRPTLYWCNGVMSVLQFELRQHPVGQGGFHTGLVSESDQRFRWVYDCGSNQLDSLHEQIRTVAGTDFDVLFLSHLDSDHVGGVDTLLLNAKVREVVLPYLGDDDWALYLAAGVANGTLSGTFVDLAAAPADWFGRRGVNRLTYIEADDDDGEMTRPDLPSPGESRGAPDAKIGINWTRSKPAGTAVSGSDRASVSVIEKGGVGSLVGSGKLLNWVLSPFAFSPPLQKMTLFRKELVGAFGSKKTAEYYANQARTDTGRASLRKCYDSVWTDHNLHSMTLYTGPASKPVNNILHTAWHGRFIHRLMPPGWLSTGDFDCSVKKRRSKLLQYNSTYATMVGQLTLPHHGSDRSFDVALLKGYDNLFAAIAAVGPNGHGHPGHQVQSDINKIPNIQFVRVDQSLSSSYVISGYICM